MSVRVRFAPSPTGFLHVGGARTALYNYLFARGQGGVFILRIEDTDAARSTEASLAAILEGLRWLGLEWDEGPGVGGTHGPYFQSQRRERYRAHADALHAAGSAYPCYCTAAELEQRREAQAARGEPPRYDGRCRGLDAAARARLEAEGRQAALRFALPGAAEVAWDDIVRGRVAFQSELLDDFVILRSDGLPTYNFACVVDDHEMDITHVIRGDDHISNTPRQLLLHQAFGWTPSRFAHVPMILGADGSRLSKRHGATSVAAYRELGYIPEAMVNFLVLLGWSYDGKQELFSLEDLVRRFRLERVGSNPAIFNLEKLEWMNGQHLRLLPEPERVRRVEEFLAARGHDLSARSPEWRAALVRAIGSRLKTLTDAEGYGGFVLRDDLTLDPAAWSELLERGEVGPRLQALAERIAADGDFSLESLERETRGLAVALDIKAGDLMSAARVALTGRKVAPGLFEVMWLLGRERTLARLRDAAARWESESPHARV
ncbi:MAG: glutamate--tRNA ligase [Candidatus Eisenbacteria bacterium RBG_16_71_46]|nr:MAG: glutamate--tRNA ligase [Candidatus Eisenbacteria bacterium RBG_16_71_46]OGF24951.1 MAG: glutamate--tRNA ligase [Candidatus Eisenbacteria bacterium RBG_19FT_COMBO_70_11]